MKKSFVLFLSLIISSMMMAQTQNGTKQNSQTVVKPIEKNKVENKSVKTKTNTAKKSNIHKSANSNSQVKNAPIKKTVPSTMKNKATKMEKPKKEN